MFGTYFVLGWDENDSDRIKALESIKSPSDCKK